MDRKYFCGSEDRQVLQPDDFYAIFKVSDLRDDPGAV
jgi:hypothetical protein